MRRTCRLAIASALALFVIAVTLPAWADTPDAGAPPWLAQEHHAELAAPGLPIGRVVLVIAFTAAVGGAAWYVRKRKSSAGGSLDRKLRVLEATRIGPKAELVVASVNGRHLLLGVTETNVRKLAWVDEEAPEAASAPASREPATSDSFTGMLRSLIGERTEDEDDAEPMPTAPAAVPIAAAPRLRKAEPPADAAAVEGQAAGLARRRRRA